jgi:hypothetical protein
VAAYYDLVPGFECLLQQKGGDLEKFYAAADQLAREPKTERDRRLRTLSGLAAGLRRDESAVGEQTSLAGETRRVSR